MEFYFCEMPFVGLFTLRLVYDSYRHPAITMFTVLFLGIVLWRLVVKSER